MARVLWKNAARLQVWSSTLLVGEGLTCNYCPQLVGVHGLNHNKGIFHGDTMAMLFFFNNFFVDRRRIQIISFAQLAESTGPQRVIEWETMMMLMMMNFIVYYIVYIIGFNYVYEYIYVYIYICTSNQLLVKMDFLFWIDTHTTKGHTKRHHLVVTPQSWPNYIHVTGPRHVFEKGLEDVFGDFRIRTEIRPTVKTNDHEWPGQVTFGESWTAGQPDDFRSGFYMSIILLGDTPPYAGL